MFSLIYAWINGWVNNGDAGDLRRHRVHYDVIAINVIYKHSERIFQISNHQLHLDIFRRHEVIRVFITWQRHQMETFSALLAICAGNSPVTGPVKGQWRGALMFSLIYAWINGWLNNGKAGNLRHHRAHYDVIVIIWFANILRGSKSCVTSLLTPSRAAVGKLIQSDLENTQRVEVHSSTYQQS